MTRPLTILLLALSLLLHAAGTVAGVRHCVCEHDTTVPGQCDNPSTRVEQPGETDCLRCPTGCPCCDAAPVRASGAVLSQGARHTPGESGFDLPAVWGITASADGTAQPLTAPLSGGEPTHRTLIRCRVLLL